MLIQKLRLQRGWSQEQLADVSGLSARTIQRIEGGQSASLETLKALAAAFAVDISTLKEPDMTVADTIPAAPTPNAVPADEAIAFAHVRKLKGFYGHATIYALDGQTGKELWSSGDTITAFNHFAGLSIANGKIYLGTYDGTFWAFGLPK